MTHNGYRVQWWRVDMKDETLMPAADAYALTKAAIARKAREAEEAKRTAESLRLLAAGVRGSAESGNSFVIADESQLTDASVRRLRDLGYEVRHSAAPGTFTVSWEPYP